MNCKKAKIIWVISAALSVLISFSGCKLLARHGWKHAYEAYTQDESGYVYQIINATIISQSTGEDCYYFALNIDAEDFLERYNYSSNKGTLGTYNTSGFYVILTNVEELEVNGFFDDVWQDTVVTFTTNNYIGWDGWQFPIFEVKIGDKTYLDFETGKENMLQYIQEQMK